MPVFRYRMGAMQKFFMTGGKPLKGTVQISGAKNAASKMIIACLLTEQTVTLENVPLQQETDIARELVTMLGATVTQEGHTMTVTAEDVSSTSVMELTRKNRLSILALAPLLHREKNAFVPVPVGDKIGPRPVNFHVDALTRMGATVEQVDGGYHATIGGRLKGALIELPYPSVMSTETILLAGVLAEGRTVIKNAAIEPEIVDLIMMLQKMGAIIEMGAGRHIEIIGVEKLGGCTHRILPDRMEAASYGALALATRGEILVRGAKHRDMVTFLNAVRRVGGSYEVTNDGIIFRGTEKYRGIKLETDTHPGFMTDWQQPFLVVLTQAEGTSVMHETVMEDRFGYTKALVAMGADITLFENCLGETPCRFRDKNYKHSVVINGPTPLTATALAVTDIRAGLAYVVAALVAKGTSEITGVEHLERGYEDLLGKLQSCGADVRAE